MLATPRLLAWLEAATVVAAVAATEEGQTSVGVQVTVDHLRATPVGAHVTVTAELAERDGRTLAFEVAATHEVDGRTEQVASGRVVRAVVDRQRFLDRLPGA